MFDDPTGSTFAQRPLLLNGVVYAANGRLWAIDARTGQVLGKSAAMKEAYSTTGTVLHDQERNQILVWSNTLQAFKPLK